MTNSRNKRAAYERNFSNVLFELTGLRLERQLDQCHFGGFDLEPQASDNSPTSELLRQHALEVKRYKTTIDAPVALW